MLLAWSERGIWLEAKITHGELLLPLRFIGSGQPACKLLLDLINLRLLAPVASIFTIKTSIYLLRRRHHVEATRLLMWYAKGCGRLGQVRHTCLILAKVGSQRHRAKLFERAWVWLACRLWHFKRGLLPSLSATILVET